MPKQLHTTTVASGHPTERLTHVDREASVLEASRLMRKAGASELLVIDKSGGGPFAFGILTANDIVTRVVAAGLDPNVLTTGDIAWSGTGSNPA